MNQLVLVTATGVAVGLLFTYLKFPIPAPSALEGVLGIVGIYLGSLLAGWLGL